MALAEPSVLAMGSGGALNGGNVTLNFGITPPANTLALVIGGQTSNAATAGVSTAGYTESSLYQNVGANCIKIATKFLSGSESSCTGRGDGDAASSSSYVWALIEGIDPTIYDITVTTAQADAAANPDPPAGTVVTAGSIGFAFMSSKVNDAGVVAPSGYSGLVSNATNDTNPHTTALAYKLNLSAGSENPGTFTCGSGDNLTLFIVLKPRTRANVYADSAAANDSADGLTSSTPKKTLAAAIALMGAGDTLNLAVGGSWSEIGTFNYGGITVQPYGTGSNPTINGGGVRNGLVFTRPDGHVTNINATNCINGLYATGANAELSVSGGTYNANGTGIVAGGGGRLVLVDGATCNDNTAVSKSGLGAGDGIQISEDASTGTHTIQNTTCDGNDIQGLNAKRGVVVATNMTLTNNKEGGFVAQIPGAGPLTFTITDSLIEGNNVDDNGVAQASLENAVNFTSRRNTYKDPVNGASGGFNLNMANLDNGASVTCESDIHTMRTGQTNAGFAIGGNFGAATVTLSFENITIDMNASGGTRIGLDLYGQTGATLAGLNNSITVTGGRCARIPPAVLTAAGANWNFNHYHRPGGGTAVEAQDTDNYTEAQIAAGDLTTDYGTDGDSVTGDPLFVDADGGDYRLLTGSPLLDAGSNAASAATDNDGDTYTNPPNIGAEADAGVPVPAASTARRRGGFMARVGGLMTR